MAEAGCKTAGVADQAKPLYAVRSGSRRETADLALALLALLILAVLLVAGRGPTGPAVAAFLLGVLGIGVAWCLAAVVAKAWERRRERVAARRLAAESSRRLKARLVSLRLRPPSGRLPKGAGSRW